MNGQLSLNDKPAGEAKTVNVYLIRDGGDDALWKAQTMADAIKLSEDRCVAENYDPLEDGTEESYRAFYRSSMIESCACLGELANP